MATRRVPVVKEPIQKTPVASEDFEILKQFLMQPATEGEPATNAKAIVTKMMEHHVYPDMSGQEAAVMSMVADAMEDYAFVIDVYRALRKARVAPSPMTLELTADACGHIGDWPTAKDVIAQMHEAVDIMHPSIEVYENAIRACHHAQKWQQAKQLLDEIQTYGLEASADIHLQVIETCITSKELTATSRLLGDFLRDFSMLEQEEVQDVLEGLLHMAITHEVHDQALFFRDQLATRGVVIPRETYEELIHLSARRGKWHSARVLLAQCTQARSLPIAAPSHQFTRDVEKLLEDMPRHDFDIPLAIYNAALRAFGATNQVEKAAKLLNDMKQRSITPDAVSYAAVMCSCGRDVQKSQEFYDEFLHQGLTPTTDIYHAYLLSPSKAKAWQTVLDRFQAILSSVSPELKQQINLDTRVLSCVAVAHGQLENNEEMLLVFTSMKVNGMLPNLYVYAEAMNAYIRNGQWRHALMLFDHMWQEDLDKERLARFPLTWDAAITAAIAGDDKERLELLYNQIVSRRGEVRPHIAAKLIDHMKAIPTDKIWSAFRQLPYLHEVQMVPSKRSWQVVNAVLMRCVGERNADLAEKVIQDAETVLHMHSFNSMTYSLMLDLYAKQKYHDKVILWCERMEEANAKLTVFTYRALLQHLCGLHEQKVSDDIASFAEAIADLTSMGELAAYKDAADLGRKILDAMDRQGFGLDVASLEHYVNLSQTEGSLASVFDRLETAASPLPITADFLHAVFLAVTEYVPSLHPRLRRFLMRCVEEQPQEIVLESIGAYCSSSSPSESLELFQLLVNHNYELEDEHFVVFLASCAVSDGQSGSESSAELSVEHLREMCQIVEERDLLLGAASVTFLMQSMLTLLRSNKQYSTDVVDIIKRLLSSALEGSSRDELRAFLTQIMSDPRDLARIDDILRLV
ncbi:hypothetical protein Poli38472_005133 [Pythium oligandrum]|uniref:Uncharacterized protein n=1 Tax=Pythium oligandrum TaxID=41045 RepID=A0A8K1CG10_PYTOL|nr:hypothetical protein Poli38472_005133 [Pythium oligandrum]|eukprot:TMW62515.1 hypothetical protein Poli38472_005133 [Pythium oligandrum]